MKWQTKVRKLQTICFLFPLQYIHQPHLVSGNPKVVWSLQSTHHMSNTQDTLPENIIEDLRFSMFWGKIEARAFTVIHLIHLSQVRVTWLWWWLLPDKIHWQQLFSGLPSPRQKIIWSNGFKSLLNNTMITEKETALKRYPLDLCLKPLNPDISMHILDTVLYTFPKILTRRICAAIQSFFSRWLFL